MTCATCGGHEYQSDPIVVIDGKHYHSKHCYDTRSEAARAREISRERAARYSVATATRRRLSCGNLKFPCTACASTETIVEARLKTKTGHKRYCRCRACGAKFGVVETDNKQDRHPSFPECRRGEEELRAITA